MRMGYFAFFVSFRPDIQVSDRWTKLNFVSRTLHFGQRYSSITIGGRRGKSDKLYGWSAKQRHNSSPKTSGFFFSGEV
jgi:hypothetical protein